MATTKTFGDRGVRYGLVYFGNPDNHIQIAAVDAAGHLVIVQRQHRQGVNERGQLVRKTGVRRVVETYDPQGTGGLYMADSSAVIPLDLTPRTFEDARRIALAGPRGYVTQDQAREQIAVATA